MEVHPKLEIWPAWKCEGLSGGKLPKSAIYIYVYVYIYIYVYLFFFYKRKNAWIYMQTTLASGWFPCFKY